MYARGALQAQNGSNEQARRDLEQAAQLSPDNAKLLDRLGQVYRAERRPADAERVLQHAAQLAPRDGTIALHLAFALRDLGRRDQAKIYFERFRGFGTEDKRNIRTGLIDFLSLDPARRRDRSIEGLRRALQDQPRNDDVRLHLGRLLLEEGDATEAATTFAALTDPGAIDAAGDELINAGCFEDAAALLGHAGRETADYAIAVLHTKGPQAATAVLDRVPPENREAAFWIAHAEIADAAGRVDSVVDALKRAVDVQPPNARVFAEAAAMLLRYQRLQDAAAVVDQALRSFPDDPQLNLDRATVLELQQRFEESRALLETIERRWPEWSRPWLVHGISFMSRGKASEARPLLEHALALGEDSQELHFYLAEALAAGSDADRVRARDEVRRALEMNPDDPYALALAGQLEVDVRDYASAESHLRRSLELLPNQKEAHYQLLRLNNATGHKDEARAEAEIIRRLESSGRVK